MKKHPTQRIHWILILIMAFCCFNEKYVFFLFIYQLWYSWISCTWRYLRFLGISKLYADKIQFIRRFYNSVWWGSFLVAHCFRMDIIYRHWCLWVINCMDELYIKALFIASAPIIMCVSLPRDITLHWKSLKIEINIFRWQGRNSSDFSRGSPTSALFLILLKFWFASAPLIFINM